MDTRYTANNLACSFSRRIYSEHVSHNRINTIISNGIIMSKASETEKSGRQEKEEARNNFFFRKRKTSAKIEK